MSRDCSIFNLGMRDYQEVYELQKKLVLYRSKQEIPDTLLLLEHPPVFTVGRKGGWNNILCTGEKLAQEGIAVYEINRGGDITYHGPGQLVGYPILDLNRHGRDIHLYIRKLEQVIIDTIGEYGIVGRRVEGYTGVWVGREKVAAIGIAVKRWVTMHGFALNVEPRLDHFSLINPCGITGRGVTSLSRLLGKAVDIEGVCNYFIDHFARLFTLNPLPMDNAKLLQFER